MKKRMDKELVNAAAHGDVHRVTELLNQGSRPDTRYEGYTPLLAAAEQGHVEVCKLLLNSGRANIKETRRGGFTAFLSAVYHGHIEVCKLLLKTGEVNVKETRPNWAR